MPTKRDPGAEDYELVLVEHSAGRSDDLVRGGPAAVGHAEVP